jgi:hypothetical protein
MEYSRNENKNEKFNLKLKTNSNSKSNLNSSDFNQQLKSEELLLNDKISNFKNYEEKENKDNNLNYSFIHEKNYNDYAYNNNKVNILNEKENENYSNININDNYNYIETLHLSLILDDENKISVDFYPDDNIEKICNEICQQNKLNNLLANKLKIKIEENLLSIYLENLDKKKHKENNIVNRLYTDAMKSKILKENYLEKIKNDLNQKELNNYSFTPKINEKSNNLYNRNHLRIEDRLYYDEINKRDKRKLKNILENKDNIEYGYSDQKDKIFKRISKFLNNK